jgi:hypothetical protein
MRTIGYGSTGKAESVEKQVARELLVQQEQCASAPLRKAKLRLQLH